jgi:hypothetical protein
MRKLAVLPVALVALGLAAAPAMAQEKPVTTFTSKAKVTPKKAGTKKNPKGVQISGSLTFRTITQGVQLPIITGGTVYLPKYGKWNGGKYPTCSGARMRQDESIDNCPKKSIMGFGSGRALADTVDAKPEVDFVNGGKNTLWAFTTLYNPALVQEPIRIAIKKISHPKWGYKATFNVPDVLQIVAGVPITLTDFSYKIGRKSYAKDLITTTGCPKSKKYPYQAEARYRYVDLNDLTDKKLYKGTVPCS